LKDHEGKGVSYCAVCDAFFYRKKRVGVIGAGEFAAHEYAALKNVAGEVYLLTNGEKSSFDADSIVDGKIARVLGRDGRVCGVEFEDGTELALDGLFVAAGVMGSGEIAKSIGAFTDVGGSIVTDERGATNVSGLYAAGDCTAGVKQIGKAVADGMMVGLALVNDLKRGG
ncbi:MAG: FAD-dependent oxidoreductase, partial [Clostridiales bacterium]|nr:FAD-dependent oxidoreductase [Clostridiales bacterium]